MSQRKPDAIDLLGRPVHVDWSKPRPAAHPWTTLRCESCGKALGVCASDRQPRPMMCLGCFRVTVEASVQEALA